MFTIFGCFSAHFQKSKEPQTHNWFLKGLDLGVSPPNYVKYLAKCHGQMIYD